jgi:hypothetical protein
MSSYQNLFPPISLAPGDVGFSFDNEAFPGRRTSREPVCNFEFCRAADSGTAPTAESIVLQESMADIDANTRPWIRVRRREGKRGR